MIYHILSLLKCVLIKKKVHTERSDRYCSNGNEQKHSLYTTAAKKLSYLKGSSSCTALKQCPWLHKVRLSKASERRPCAAHNAQRLHSSLWNRGGIRLQPLRSRFDRRSDTTHRMVQNLCRISSGLSSRSTSRAAILILCNRSPLTLVSGSLLKARPIRFTRLRLAEMVFKHQIGVLLMFITRPVSDFFLGTPPQT